MITNKKIQNLIDNKEFLKLRDVAIESDDKQERQLAIDCFIENKRFDELGYIAINSADKEQRQQAIDELVKNENFSRLRNIAIYSTCEQQRQWIMDFFIKNKRFDELNYVATYSDKEQRQQAIDFLVENERLDELKFKLIPTKLRLTKPKSDGSFNFVSENKDAQGITLSSANLRLFGDVFIDLDDKEQRQQAIDELIKNKRFDELKSIATYLEDEEQVEQIKKFLNK